MTLTLLPLNELLSLLLSDKAIPYLIKPSPSPLMTVTTITMIKLLLFSKSLATRTLSFVNPKLIDEGMTLRDGVG